MSASPFTWSPPPPLLPLHRDGIPAELLTYDQWVTWQLRWRAGKDGKPGGWTKPPTSPLTGRTADSGKPSTWGPSDRVLGVCDRVGFVLTEHDPFCFLDLDDAIDPLSDEIKPWAREIVDRVPTYWERSPTNTGLKGLLRGRPPQNRIIRVGDGQVEVFGSGKFTTLTGHRIEGSSATINDCQAELDALFADLTAGDEARTTPRDLPPLDLDDEAILERVRRMPKGRRLHDDGDASGYASASEADLGLCNCYVAAGATDPDQIDRLFRASALHRDKWARDGYRERTITRALDGTVRPMATPAPRPNRHLAGLLPADDLTADDLPDDPVALKRLIATRLAQLDRLQARVDELEAENARLHDANRTLSLLQSKTMAAFRSRNLGAEKATGIAIAFELANQQAAHPNRDEFVIPYARIADQAGLSESTVGTHVKERLDPLDLWERRTRFVPERIDRETGEIFPAKNQTVFVPKVDPLGILDVLATARTPSGKAKNNWGGRADRGTVCSKHPDAGVVKRVSYHCRECDAVLHREADQPQDAAPTRPNRQDAGWVVDGIEAADEEANGTTGVTHPSVDNHYRNPSERVCHNDPPPIPRFNDGGTSVVAAWQSAQPLPGMGAPPADRWTG